MSTGGQGEHDERKPDALVSTLQAMTDLGAQVATTLRLMTDRILRIEQRLQAVEDQVSALGSAGTAEDRDL